MRFAWMLLFAAGCVTHATFDYHDANGMRSIEIATPRWTKTIPTHASDDIITTGNVAIDPRGDVVFTTIVGDPSEIDCVAGKLARRTGAVLWQRHFDGHAGLVDHCRSIAVDRHGDAFIVGYTPFQSVGSNDWFVTKLDGRDGDTLWTRRFGGTSNDMARVVAIDRTGAIVVGGSFGGEGPGDMAIGTTTLHSVGGFDAFIAKLAPDGTPLWARGFGGAGFDYVGDLVLDRSGSVYVAAEISAHDAFAVSVLRMSRDGEIAWRHDVDGAAVPRAITLSNGRVVLDLAHVPSMKPERRTFSP